MTTGTRCHLPAMCQTHWASPRCRGGGPSCRAGAGSCFRGAPVGFCSGCAWERGEEESSGKPTRLRFSCRIFPQVKIPFPLPLGLLQGTGSARGSPLPAGPGARGGLAAPFPYRPLHSHLPLPPH